MHVPRGKATCIHKREQAVCKPRKGTSGETNPASTLILELPSSRTGRKEVSVLTVGGKNLWYFVLVALAY
jgi:hypothetical protein